MNGASKPYGMIAEFTTAADILHAAQKVRDAGFSRWDVFTAFPVHGMDGAMGMRNSPVGWFSFLGGATGYASGMLMVWYMNAYDYPIVIGGKPMFSPFYPFVPCFELTILLASANRMIRIPLAGLAGPVQVAGQPWNLAMPAMGAALPDDDLAAVLTYIRQSWGNKASAVTPEQVKAVRTEVGNRTQPWTVEQLNAIQ
jgi:hypothetical protein